MRLRAEDLGTAEQLKEFDQWLTARLERIKDTEKFNLELSSLCNCIETLAPLLEEFADSDLCTTENLCEAVIEASGSLITGKSFVKDEAHVTAFFEAVFNLLFLVTGATDNNLKNHFLIKLVSDEVKPLLPKRSGSGKKVKFSLTPIPPTTKSVYVAKALAACFVGAHPSYEESVKTEPVFSLEQYLKIFLNEYMSLILESEEESLQFWAICNSYVRLNNMPEGESLGKHLLNSCTVFKVRGSVSASGGHITETILREKLVEIGLRPETDFNMTDVKIGEEEVVEAGKRKKKTRAYDFILPNNVEGWEPKQKLFIQSQFYAGDSGSVSHKVVDQTQSSRAFTLGKYENARFVEYLDGAGYYAALRGDLEHMLSFDDTASFFQVKSILIRLRRELQVIKFMTPVEFAHAILTSDGDDRACVHQTLREEGYSDEEIMRVEDLSLNSGFFELEEGRFHVGEDNLDIARKLLILDLAANSAIQLTEAERKSQKYILVPGYGADQGVLESTLSELSCAALKRYALTAPMFASDVEWLLDEGVIRRQ